MNALSIKIKESKDTTRLFLANLILENISNNTVWLDQCFNGYNIEIIEEKIANYTQGYLGTTTINGFVTDLGIETIIEQLGMDSKRNINILDMSKAVEILLSRRRIFEIKNVIPGYGAPKGYCVVSTKKILGAEVGIDGPNETKNLREISALKAQISQNNLRVQELESELEASRSSLKDKDAVLAGRANLTWS
jgi:hypothetical protein